MGANKIGKTIQVKKFVKNTPYALYFDLSEY